MECRSSGTGTGETVGKAAPKSEADIILMAIAKEKESYAHFAAAARTCSCPKAKRLYNQLALDELKHVLRLVSLLDGVADDCLDQLDLTFPGGRLPDPLPQSEDSILRSALAEERQARQLFADLAEGVKREEILAVLDLLRAEEEDHLARLRSLMYGLEADRPVVAKWLRSIRRMVPAGNLH